MGTPLLDEEPFPTTLYAPETPPNAVATRRVDDGHACRASHPGLGRTVGHTPGPGTGSRRREGCVRLLSHLRGNHGDRPRCGLRDSLEGEIAVGRSLPAAENLCLGRGCGPQCDRDQGEKRDTRDRHRPSLLRPHSAAFRARTMSWETVPRQAEGSPFTPGSGMTHGG